MKKREEDEPTPSSAELLLAERKKLSAVDGLEEGEDVLARLAVLWWLAFHHLGNDIFDGSLAIHKFDNTRWRLIERENSPTLEEADVSLEIFSDPKPAIDARFCDSRGKGFILLTIALSDFPAIESTSDIEVQKAGNTTRQSDDTLLFWFRDELVRRIVRRAKSRGRTATAAEVRTKPTLTRQVRERVHDFETFCPNLN